MSPFLPPKVSHNASASGQSFQNSSKKPDKGVRASGDLQRTPSLGSWFKQILPSNRPERGGTIRPSEPQMQKNPRHINNGKPPRPAPQNRLNQKTGASAADSVTAGWTAPQNVSGGKRVQIMPEMESVLDDVRKWGWASGDDLEQRGKGKSRNVSRPAPVGTNDNESKVVGDKGSRSSSNSAPDLQSMQAKQEARRLRRNLKESGDYLGVQGFNPQTGQLDVMTPTDSDGSSLSQETQQKLLVLKSTLKDARHRYKSARERSEQEARKILLREKEKLHRLRRGKEGARGIQRVTWRRHTRQWSSLQEPNLSPIAQSVAQTPAASRRQSNARAASVANVEYKPSLADLEFSEKEAVMGFVPHQSDRELTKTPDSTSTVVRTPHRQSFVDFAEMGPSPWELFVNGISPDTSEDAEQRQENQPISLDAQEWLAKAHNTGEVLPPEDEPCSDDAVAQASAESFLGAGTDKVDDPRGRKGQVGSLPRGKKQTARQEMSQGDVKKNCGRDVLPLRYRSRHCDVDTTDHENKGPLKRRSMPDWGHWTGRGLTRLTQNAKPKGTPMMNGLVKTSPRQHEDHGAPAQGLASSPSWSSGGSDADPTLARPVAPTRRLMLTLSKHTEYLGPYQETEQREQTTAADLAASKMRADMTRGGEDNQTDTRKDEAVESSCKVVAKCASTHTITTIGCDRVRSKPTKVQATPGQKSTNKRQAQLHQRGRAMYSLPVVAISESSLGHSAMRMLQKPSSRAKLAKDDDGIGITSEYDPKQADGRMRKNTDAVVKEMNVTDQRSNERCDMLVAQAEPRWRQVADVSMMAQTLAQAANVARGDDGSRGDLVVVKDELTALVQAPGRFPCASVDGQDLAVGDCEAARMADGIVLVWCYVVPLWQMYWEQVGLPFNMRTWDDWATRRDEVEGAVACCFAMVVLAIPPCLLLMAGYVVALGMGVSSV